MIEQTQTFIWDVPTRVTHWLLAIGVTLNLFILEEGELLHEWVGYIAVALVVFRLIWGFVGAKYSRFASFPVHPRSILSFIKEGMNSQKINGHNPLASLTYFAIWALILSLGVTGFMMGLDAYWGEEWLEDLHGQIATALQVLIAIHLIGVALDSFRYKRKTWLSMISGKK